MSCLKPALEDKIAEHFFDSFLQELQNTDTKENLNHDAVKEKTENKLNFLSEQDAKIFNTLIFNVTVDTLTAFNSDGKDEVAEVLESIKAELVNDLREKCEQELLADRTNFYDILKTLLAKKLSPYGNSVESWLDWSEEKIAWGKRQVEANAPNAIWAAEQAFGFFSQSAVGVRQLAERGVNRFYQVMGEIDAEINPQPVIMQENEKEGVETDTTPKARHAAEDEDDPDNPFKYTTL